MRATSQLRVAIATPSYPPELGGLGTLVRNLAVELVTLECQVTVLCQVNPRMEARRPRIERPREEFTVQRFPNRFGGRRFGYAPSLRRYVKENDLNFDVVHAFSFHAPVALAIIGVTNQPFFFSPVFHAAGHSRLADAAHLLYNPIAKAIFEKADVVFCSSHAEREELLQLYPFCADWANVVPITVESDLFDGVTPYDAPRPVILSAGRLDSYKHVDTVIEAMTQLDDSAELVICGSGPDKTRLRDMIERLGVGGSVRLLGKVSDEDLRRWQRTATVAVSLSTHESFGLSLAEGAVAGATIVASDIPAHREMTKATGVTAELVPTSASPSEVASVLKHALAAHDTRDSRAVTRRWEDVARETMQFYERALAAGRRGGLANRTALVPSRHLLRRPTME